MNVSTGGNIPLLYVGEPTTIVSYLNTSLRAPDTPNSPALLHARSWMAYGTPWSGKHDLSTNEGVPVGGIVCLQRGSKNEIAPMGVAGALPFLMGQTLYHLRAENMDIKLALLDRLLKDIPVWDLKCLPDDEAAIMCRDAITK